MRDGWLRRTIKAVVRSIWAAEHALRGLGRRRSRWVLAGDCNGCGQCCVAPTIAVGRLLWRWPTPRRLFLAWQRSVNGFVLTDRLRGGVRAFVFRCSHYDPESRRCDSYDSRPWMCRRYPRVLLNQPWPELFEDCSHSLVDRQGAGLAAALDAEGLDPAVRARLQRALRLPGGTPGSLESGPSVQPAGPEDAGPGGDRPTRQTPGAELRSGGPDSDAGEA